MGDYYRINSEASHTYGEFYDIGITKDVPVGDFTSENTKRLTVKEVEKLLLSLDYIKQEVKSMKVGDKKKKK